MKRSIDRILTTHVGSLPRPNDLIPMLRAKDSSEPYDEEALARRVSQAVSDVVRKQADLGIDIINDGEHSKSGYGAYTPTRLTGFSLRPELRERSRPSRDYLAFPAVYDEFRAMFATRPRRTARRQQQAPLVCTGPVSYIGQKQVEADIDNLKAALEATRAEEGFMTAIAPTQLASYYPNEYYRTLEEYHIALADAMHEEYKAIVDAGMVLQLDDPLLATHWNSNPGISLEECRRFIAGQIEVLNYTFRGVPQDRVRYHTCYSTNVGPRVHDLPLKDYADLLVEINAGGYLIEAANVRHEHEWRVWEDVKLPEDKVLIPGVISHADYLVEHPEVVAQRIVRFAGVLGRERVIASNDCGFATASGGDEVHPDVAWAKVQALAEGARLASQKLWKR